MTPDEESRAGELGNSPDSLINIFVLVMISSLFLESSSSLINPLNLILFRCEDFKVRKRERFVEVFDLQGHPTAKRCDAWSHAIDDSKKKRFFAALHQGPGKSAQDAVKAAIVQEYKTKKA